MTSLACATPPAAADPPAAPPPVSAAPVPAGRRLWELDALRGLMLVLMTLTHLPTRVSDPAGQPFGYVSAAEGFVLLSAFMAGMVYTQRELKDGGEVMARAFWQRAFKIYVLQLALLLGLFSVVALIAVLTQQDAAKNLMSFFFERPKMAIFSGLLLIYSPPLLDILPMYVLFMLASPIVLLHGRRHGWFGVLALSVALWLMAQFDLGRALYDVTVQVTGLPVPFPQTGAFELFGWQFLWVLGLWLGAAQADAPDAPPLRFPRWMVRTAIAYALLCFAWRHAVGQVPFPGEPGLNLMFDKWHLAPLRLLNVFALLVLVLHFAPQLRAALPRFKSLEMLGAASLPVFCAHLVLALLALALYGEVSPQRPYWIDGVILVAAFASMFAVAWISAEADRRSARLRREMKERRQARRAAREARLIAGGRRSPNARGRSPQG